MAKRKIFVNAVHIRARMDHLGLSIEELAQATRAWQPRTIQMLLSTSEATRAVIDDVCTALNLDFDEVTSKSHRPTEIATQATPLPTPQTFTFSLQVTGIVASVEQLQAIVSLTPEIESTLSKLGIDVRSIHSQLGLQSRSQEPPFTVVLLQGRNTFGKQIYTYLKLGLQRISELEAALQSDAGFTPLTFGEVVACGYDAPPDEVRTTITQMFHLAASPYPDSKPKVE